MSDAAPRTITVIETTVIKQGTSDSGKPWALREVTAIGENGEPIDLKLKTFDDLKGTVQVEVERQEHEKFGVSYLLKLPRGSEGSHPPPAGARLGPKVDAVETRVAQLETDVTYLKEVVAQLTAPRAGQTPPPKPKPSEVTF